MAEIIICERLGLLRQMKAITEESLTVFNKHSFAFESRLIERREDRISQVMLELCERAILEEIPVSVSIASLNRDLQLRVSRQ